jgi:hypothetical protein
MNLKKYTLIVGLSIAYAGFCLAQKEINIPCSAEGHSNATYFRASNSAKSKDMAMAKDKAIMLTKQMLSSLISSTMKSVTENYVNQLDASAVSEFKQNFENVTREVVNQQIKDVKITCEKTEKLKTGMYQTFIALEVSKDVIVNGISKSITTDKKLEQQFDEAKFKETFEAEMKKLDKQE